MKVQKVYVSEEEAKALDSIKKKLPVLGSYKDLLSLEEVKSVKWNEGAIFINSMLGVLYKNELAKDSKLLSDMMTSLDNTVDDFASDVKKVFPDMDAKEYAQGAREYVFREMTMPQHLRLVLLEEGMTYDVGTGKYIQGKSALEACEDIKLLDVLSKKAKVNFKIEDELWGRIARYGMLSAGKVIFDDQINLADAVQKNKAYVSLTLAKTAHREIKDKELHKELKDNIASMEKNLEARLGIDSKKVKEYIKTETEEDIRQKVIERYNNEIKCLESGNQRTMKEIYSKAEEGNEPGFVRRYELIVNLFREALLNEAVGNKEKTEELCDDINCEFDDFLAVMEDPRLLLVQYKDFTSFCKGLEIPLKESLTGKIEEKIKNYEEARKAKKKGLFKGKDAPKGFITGKTLTDVMSEYQNRFALDKVKVQVLTSDREIEQRKKMEEVVKSFVSGLMLAEMDRQVLNDWDITMKKGETYSQNVLLQNKDYIEKIGEIGAGIQDVSERLAKKRLKEKEREKLRAELGDLQHAMYELRSRAVGIMDPMQMAACKEAISEDRIDEDDLVQIPAELTEEDIGGSEGLVRDTFIQYVTRTLGGKRIIPSLDSRIHAETKTGYDVEKAWSEVKAALPVFEAIEKHGIQRLAREVGQVFLQESNPRVLIGAVVDNFFKGYKERTGAEKLKDAATGFLNRVKLLKAKIE